MSLENEIKEVLDDFEHTSTERFLEILKQIKPHFKNKLISEYVQGKIQKILDSADDGEKKKQCKALMPYLDWYLQGL
jgi:hypothetical protein